MSSVYDGLCTPGWGKAVLSGDVYLSIWVYKWVGMKGRGEGRLLSWIISWALHQGSVDGKVRPVVQQGFDSLMGKVTHLCRVYKL